MILIISLFLSPPLSSYKLHSRKRFHLFSASIFIQTNAHIHKWTDPNNFYTLKILSFFFSFFLTLSLVVNLVSVKVSFVKKNIGIVGRGEKQTALYTFDSLFVVQFLKFFSHLATMLFFFFCTLAHFYSWANNRRCRKSFFYDVNDNIKKIDCKFCILKCIPFVYISHSLSLSTPHSLPFFLSFYLSLYLYLFLSLSVFDAKKEFMNYI